MTIRERLKSWAVWLSVLGAVGLILENVGLFELWGITGIIWDSVVNAIGAILVGFGILNNPTDRQNF